MRAMMMSLMAGSLLALSASGWTAPANVKAAVAASSARSADNVKLDANRKPAELLAFLGLERGMRVLDLFGANRYWAEIMAPAVGAQGQVVVWQPTQFINDKRRAEFATFAAKQGNAFLSASPFEQPNLAPGIYDFALMNLDYHDVYWQSEERKIPRMEPDAWLKILFEALKPGGVIGVIDHVAAPGGDTRAVVEKVHRIDPAVVRADFERAGFVLEAESDLLRNPADDHSLLVFDEKIRGKTDRFVFKFRKPR